MSYESVKGYFENLGLANRVMAFDVSSATVEEAAKAIGCEPKQIAKTMSLFLEDDPILIVTAGDAKIDNSKYKQCFHKKAKMIPSDQVEALVGHAPGGVCPFDIKPGVKVYMDVSLKRFDTIYPAGGSGHSAIRLSLEELLEYANYVEWVDVCKGWIPDCVE